MRPVCNGFTYCEALEKAASLREQAIASGTSDVPYTRYATQSDVDALFNKGPHGLLGEGLHGVIDRLHTSGLWPSHIVERLLRPPVVEGDMSADDLYSLSELCLALARHAVVHADILAQDAPVVARAMRDSYAVEFALLPQWIRTYLTEAI